jgi:hypothetical protein
VGKLFQTFTLIRSSTCFCVGMLAREGTICFYNLKFCRYRIFQLSRFQQFFWGFFNQVISCSASFPNQTRNLKVLLTQISSTVFVDFFGKLLVSLLQAWILFSKVARTQAYSEHFRARYEKKLCGLAIYLLLDAEYILLVFPFLVPPQWAWDFFCSVLWVM